MGLARRRAGLPPAGAGGPRPRLGAGRQPLGPADPRDRLPGDARDPRADGGLGRAGAALARGGLRAAGGRGDGRRACRWSARAAPRSRRSRATRRPWWTRCDTRSIAHGIERVLDDARSPRDQRAQGARAQPRVRLGHDGRAHARLLPQGPGPTTARRCIDRDRRRASCRAGRRAPAATSATCCATGATPATTLVVYFNGPRRARPRARPRRHRRRAPLGDGVARAGLWWQELRLPRGRPRATPSTSSSRRPTPARCALDRPRVTAVHDLSFFALPQDFTWLDAARRRALVTRQRPRLERRARSAPPSRAASSPASSPTPRRASRPHPARPRRRPARGAAARRGRAPGARRERAATCSPWARS